MPTNVEINLKPQNKFESKMLIYLQIYKKTRLNCTIKSFIGCYLLRITT